MVKFPSFANAFPKQYSCHAKRQHGSHRGNSILAQSDIHGATPQGFESKTVDFIATVVISLLATFTVAGRIAITGFPKSGGRRRTSLSRSWIIASGAKNSRRRIANTPHGDDLAAR